MTLPSNWTLVPITATFLNRDGLPAVGYVTFESMQAVIVDGIVIVPKTITAHLDGNGQISVSVPSTNDPDLNVTGWAYTVTEHMDNGRPPYLLEVPYTIGAIDLATIPPAVNNPVDPVGSFLRTSDIGVIVSGDVNLRADLSSSDAGKGSELLRYLAPFTGTVPRTQEQQNADFLSVKSFGVAGNGSTDDTATLTAAFVNGGNLYVPGGDYLIAGTGPDSGGVSVTITKSTRIICDPQARFFTDSLDNDLIRFTVPSDGSGLPADGITFEWSGGTFDQRSQKVSTTVPNIAEYPPPSGLVGTSATCDGLSVRGTYTVTGTEFSGIKRCLIDGVTTIAGSHWEVAGGDSGIFVEGCEEQHVTRCRNFGNRDLGVYASGSPNGTLRCRTVIERNAHINCFHGASMKRSLGYGRIVGSHAENCVRGFQVELLVGTGSVGPEIADNTANRCGTFIRAQLCHGIDIHDNRFTSLGALLADGSTIEPVAGASGLNVQGCVQGSIRRNYVLGETTGTAAAYPTTRNLIDCVVETTTTTQCSFLTWVGNVGDGLRAGGQDTGTNNAFIENVVYNAGSSANMTALGTNPYEVRVNVTTGARSYRHQTVYADGSATAPIIARDGQTNTGMFFGANLVGLSVATTARFQANNLGVGFNAATPAARPTYGAPTGTATRTTFDTTTVTLPQLAERVKAIIDDFRTYGLFG